MLIAGIAMCIAAALCGALSILFLMLSGAGGNDASQRAERDAARMAIAAACAAILGGILILHS